MPHGALQDSGMVAAAAYSLLLPAAAALQSPLSKQPPQQPQAAGAATLPILLLGTNHFTSSPPACLSSMAAWRTPLGDVPVDGQLTIQLAAAGLPFDDTPHRQAS